MGMYKSIIILSGILISFSTIPAESNNTYEKIIDNDLRKQYYAECKVSKGSRCHMFAFNRAISLRITYEE